MAFALARSDTNWTLLNYYSLKNSLTGYGLEKGQPLICSPPITFDPMYN